MRAILIWSLLQTTSLDGKISPLFLFLVLASPIYAAACIWDVAHLKQMWIMLGLNIFPTHKLSVLFSFACFHMGTNFGANFVQWHSDAWSCLFLCSFTADRQLSQKGRLCVRNVRQDALQLYLLFECHVLVARFQFLMPNNLFALKCDGQHCNRNTNRKKNNAGCVSDQPVKQTRYTFTPWFGIILEPKWIFFAEAFFLDENDILPTGVLGRNFAKTVGCLFL